MADGNIIPINKQPKIYRFTETSLAIDAPWGTMFVGTGTYYISDAGDLTTKDVFVQFQNRSGYTAEVSVDLISTNAIQITYVRAAPGTINGEFVVYVYDR